MIGGARRLVARATPSRARHARYLGDGMPRPAARGELGAGAKS